MILPYLIITKEQKKAGYKRLWPSGNITTHAYEKHPQIPPMTTDGYCVVRPPHPHPPEICDQFKPDVFGSAP